MPEKAIPFAIILFLHNLFLVIWMGGLIVNALSFLPAVKGTLGPGPQMKQVMHTFMKQQSRWVYVSMVGLVITGFLMSRRSPEFTGLFSFANP